MVALEDLTEILMLQGGSGSALPGHIVISPNGGGGRNADSAYLGPKYGSVTLGGAKPPQFSERPPSLAEESSISVAEAVASTAAR